MHSIKILSAGFALLGLLLLVAPRLRASGAQPIGFAVGIFIPLWFAGALIDLWIGINRAGYSAVQEWPIFALVFGLPATVAWVIRWRFGKVSS